jgi:hypothetical protein
MKPTRYHAIDVVTNPAKVMQYFRPGKLGHRQIKQHQIDRRVVLAKEVETTMPAIRCHHALSNKRFVTTRTAMSEPQQRHGERPW